jgi:hypothetical protein
VFYNMYSIYQIARDIDAEREKEARQSRILRKIRKPKGRKQA